MNQSKNKQRKLDVYFDRYSKLYSTLNSKIVQGVCAFLILFSILGLSWSLPFPYLRFLGQYNSYFNWASFVIAFSIYYYSTLSPLLSYLMLFLALVFTYLISILEKWISNPTQMGECFGLILLTSLIIHHLHQNRISKEHSVNTIWVFIWIGPIWISSFMLKKFKLRY